MQTAMTQSTFMAGQAVRAAAPTPRASRAAVVVRASGEESRRAVLGGMLAGVAALTASSAQALDLVDDRGARAKGFDIIYEARDLELDQSVRDGFTQARANLGEVKKRIAESERRIDSVVAGLVSKGYWTEGRNELRHQTGTLRFDINVIADTLPKAAKKDLLASKTEFLAAVDELDFAMRKKNQSLANSALEATKAKLDALVAKLA